jgi:hypothetical protein
MATPSPPPMDASNRLSVRSWRIRRVRVAPSDKRTASSRCRDAARESSRFATFAHTISSTITTTPVSIETVRTSLVLASFMPWRPESTSSRGTSLGSGLRSCARAASVRRPTYASIPERAVASNTPAKLPCTCSAVTPGLSRPITSSHQVVA